MLFPICYGGNGGRLLDQAVPRAESVWRGAECRQGHTIIIVSRVSPD